MDLRTLLIRSLSFFIKHGPYINYKKYPDIVEKVIKLLKILASSVLLSRIINIDEAALFIAPKKF